MHRDEQQRREEWFWSNESMLKGGVGSDIDWCQRVVQKNHDASSRYHLIIGLCNAYNIMIFMFKKT